MAGGEKEKKNRGQVREDRGEVGLKVFHSTRTGEDGISRSVGQEGRMVMRDENKEGVGIRRVCGKVGASGTEGD